jgi:hypothetical protein
VPHLAVLYTEAYALSGTTTFWDSHVGKNQVMWLFYDKANRLLDCRIQWTVHKSPCWRDAYDWRGLRWGGSLGNTFCEYRYDQGGGGGQEGEGGKADVGPEVVDGLLLFKYWGMVPHISVHHIYTTSQTTWYPLVFGTAHTGTWCSVRDRDCYSLASHGWELFLDEGSRHVRSW